MEWSTVVQRRRYPRVAVDVPVRVSTIDPELDPYTGRPFFRAFEDRAVDLSRGGLRLRTGESLLPGRRVLLELDLPDAPFEAIARVAWTARTPQAGDALDVGIEFIGASTPRAGLERFLGEAARRAA
ncbi:MAG TPA: PilZ domain-containing protein [Myxococcota bacterium]